jgi:hypothetical protein
MFQSFPKSVQMIRRTGTPWVPVCRSFAKGAGEQTANSSRPMISLMGFAPWNPERKAQKAKRQMATQ